MSDLLEHLPAMPPLCFLELAIDVYKHEGFPSFKKPFMLPDLTEMHGEDIFADVAMAWSLRGLYFQFRIESEFVNATYPKVEEGDTIELWIDTRDLKDIGVVHKFCHHFVFFPEEIAGALGMEITAFRGEDTHVIAPPEVFEVIVHPEKKETCMDIFIPKEALFGFDPVTCPRLGFTYKINRKKLSPQHFSLSSEHFNISRHPSLWSTLNLKENL